MRGFYVTNGYCQPADWCVRNKAGDVVKSFWLQRPAEEYAYYLNFDQWPPKADPMFPTYEELRVKEAV